MKIGEQHFGQRVIDPAAQTELSSILQECGFKLVDANSTNRAQVEITGDAFSAYGMRKGNLISCKSRIEIQAHKQNGDLITVDRQTSVGVDIAEQMAAKTALAKCRVRKWRWSDCCRNFWPSDDVKRSCFISQMIRTFLSHE